MLGAQPAVAPAGRCEVPLTATTRRGPAPRPLGSREHVRQRKLRKPRRLLRDRNELADQARLVDRPWMIQDQKVILVDQRPCAVALKDHGTSQAEQQDQRSGELLRMKTDASTFAAEPYDVLLGVSVQRHSRSSKT